jgi:polyribonucleotide nucleotidyltransferase
MQIELQADIGGTPLRIQAGKLAKQSSGAVVVQYGETIVLVTVVVAKEEKESSFLPLSVEYQEKIYAAGRIPGNYFRREIGRPSEKETLTARLIDRPIRPLFPKEYRREIQVIATVLSMDQENDPDVLAMVGASAALEISQIPFAGPIASVRVGRIDGQFIANPTISQWGTCDINIIVAGSKTGVVMVEGSGKIVSESDMLEAIFFGHRALQPLIDIQTQLREAVGVPKEVFTAVQPDPELARQLSAAAEEPMRAALGIAGKIKRHERIASLKAEMVAQMVEEFGDRQGEMAGILE